MLSGGLHTPTRLRSSVLRLHAGSKRCYLVRRGWMRTWDAEKLDPGETEDVFSSFDS